MRDGNDLTLDIVNRNEEGEEEFEDYDDEDSDVYGLMLCDQTITNHRYHPEENNEKPNLPEEAVNTKLKHTDSLSDRKSSL